MEFDELLETMKSSEKAESGGEMLPEVQTYEIDRSDLRMKNGLTWLETQAKAIARFIDETTIPRQAMLNQLQGLKITDKESHQRMVELVARVVEWFNAFEKARKDSFGDYAKLLSRVNASFKVGKDAMEALKRQGSQKIMAYQQQVELARKKEELRLKAEAEEQRKKIEAEAKEIGIEAPEIPAPVLPVEEKVRSSSGGGVHMRVVWDIEVEDLAKVPVELLLFNKTEAMKRVNAGVREIPGCRIFETQKGVFRR